VSGLEIRNWKLEIRKTGDREKGWTSNIKRSTSNVDIASLIFLIKLKRRRRTIIRR